MQSPLLKRALPALLLTAAAAWAIRPLHVQTADMAPSIQPGDWVLWLPLAPRQGDVVLLRDPNDPDRRILRRVIGEPGQQVVLTAPGLLVDGQQWRWREMARAEGWVVYSEQDGWLVRTADRPFNEATVTLAADSGYILLADHRDGPVDSRLWASIPSQDIQGRVWLRLGPGDLWRGALSWGAQDGPWLPPSKLPPE